VATRAERVWANQATFRDANERIVERAGEYGIEDGVPFICECDDVRCTAVVRLGLAHYADVRANPARFLVAPGHEPADVGRVVERRDGLEIVEKHESPGT
jgi:hypothetical protein